MRWSCFIISVVASVVPGLWHRTLAGKSTCGGSESLPWEAHRRTVTIMASNDFVVGEDYLLVHVARGMTYERTGEAR